MDHEFPKRPQGYARNREPTLSEALQGVATKDSPE